MDKHKTALIAQAVILVAMACAIPIAKALPLPEEAFKEKRDKERLEIYARIEESIDIEEGSLMEAAINEIDDDFTKSIYTRLPKIDIPTLEEVNKLKEIELHNTLTSEQLRYDEMSAEEFERYFSQAYTTNPSTVDKMINTVAPKMIGALITDLSEYSAIEPKSDNYEVTITAGIINTNNNENREFEDILNNKYTIQTHEVFLDNRKIANIYIATDETGFIASMQLQVTIDRLKTTAPIKYTFTANEIENSFKIAKILNVNRQRQESYGLMQPWCAVASVNTVDSLYNPYSNLPIFTAKAVLPIVKDAEAYDCNGIWTEAAKDTAKDSAYNTSISDDPLMEKRFHNGLNRYQIRDLLGIMSTGESTVYNKTNYGGITSAVSKIKANKPFVLSLSTKQGDTWHATTIIGYIDSDIIIGSDPSYITGNNDLYMLYVNKNKAPDGKIAYLSTIRYFQPESIASTSSGRMYSIEYTIVPNNRPIETREISYKDIVDIYYRRNINEVISKQEEIVPKYFMGNIWNSEIDEYFRLNREFDRWTRYIYETEKGKKWELPGSLIDTLEATNPNNIRMSIPELLKHGLIEEYEYISANEEFKDRLERASALSITSLTEESQEYLKFTNGTAVEQYILNTYFDNPEWTAFSYLAGVLEDIGNENYNSWPKVDTIATVLDNNILNDREYDVADYLDTIFSLRRHNTKKIQVPSVSQVIKHLKDGECILLSLEESSNIGNASSEGNREVIMIYAYENASGGAVGDNSKATFKVWSPSWKVNTATPEWSSEFGELTVEKYETGKIRTKDIISAVVLNSSRISKDTYDLKYNEFKELE